MIYETSLVYVLSTGCQWKALPTERFGSASAVHQKFMDWSKTGFFEEVWKAGLAEYDELEAIVVTRPAPEQRRSKHLCADAGDCGKKAMKVILAHGYIPHVVSRKREADQNRKRRHAAG